MLSVGFGLGVRVIFDVEKINKTYAKVIGIIFLLIGILPYLGKNIPDISSQPAEGSDPFLIYYFVTIPIIVGLHWLTLSFTSGPAQLRAARGSFILVGALATVLVLWRTMDVLFYMNAPDRYTLPLGLYERHNYLPYFIVIGAGFVASLMVIYTNTKGSTNSRNRTTILSYFIILCIYLAGCRLAWELVDYFVEWRIPLP